MDPIDFLETANDLVTGSREADWRSAVSRAYYAVFHLAHRLLRSLGFRPPNGEQVHGYLWLRLSNAGHTDLANAGVGLKKLRTSRNWADYDLGRLLDDDTAWRAVDSATVLSALLQAVEGEPAVRAQITQTMRDYERDVLSEVTWAP